MESLGEKIILQEWLPSWILSFNLIYPFIIPSKPRGLLFFLIIKQIPSTYSILTSLNWGQFSPNQYLPLDFLFLPSLEYPTGLSPTWEQQICFLDPTCWNKMFCFSLTKNSWKKRFTLCLHLLISPFVNSFYFYWSTENALLNVTRWQTFVKYNDFFSVIMSHVSHVLSETFILLTSPRVLV